MDKRTGRIYSGGKLYLDEFFSSYTFGDTIFHSFPPEVRDVPKPKEMKDLLDFVIETFNNAEESEIEENVSTNATYDDIIISLDNILFQLDIIEFLVLILSDAAEEYPESCDIPDETILHWICDQILDAVIKIKDEFAFIETNPVGRIATMYGWFKFQIDSRINRYMRDLGANRYKSILNNTECATGINGLKGAVIFLRKHGHSGVKYYTERLRLFAYREKESNTP